MYSFICLTFMQGANTVAERSKASTVSDSSNTGILGSNYTRGMNVCVRLFCACTVLCEGCGLAMGRSAVPEILKNISRMEKVKSGCF